ncbi:MAG: thioredoxin domain-containing protein, partial [bacterium]|nr:thioredoxin domain-containing protein [bacterium]
LTGEFGDKIGFTYRHFPLTTLHKNSMQATWVAEAAGAQGKFWEMHDKLLDMQKDWENEANPTDKFISYAQDLGLNIDTFKVDMESSLLHSKVQAQTDSGNRAGVNATPTLFLNGKKLELPRSYQDLKNIVQTELDK